MTRYTTFQHFLASPDAAISRQATDQNGWTRVELACGTYADCQAETPEQLEALIHDLREATFEACYQR